MAVKKQKAKKRPVVVTTTNYGVFFGYTTEDGRGETIALTGARNAFYWKVPVGTGLAQLSLTGPIEGSKIGAAADVVLRSVARVYQCTPEAERVWIGSSWSK